MFKEIKGRNKNQSYGTLKQGGVKKMPLETKTMVTIRGGRQEMICGPSAIANNKKAHQAPGLRLPS